MERQIKVMSQNHSLNQPNNLMLSNTGWANIRRVAAQFDLSVAELLEQINSRCLAKQLSSNEYQPLPKLTEDGRLLLPKSDRPDLGNPTQFDDSTQQFRETEELRAFRAVANYSSPNQWDLVPEIFAPFQPKAKFPKC
jgi:hypothetical protein